MASSLRDGILLCVGNPLLDMAAFMPNDDLLKKYNLLPDNAVIADEKHKPLYKELSTNYKLEYFAGGSALNTARIVQKILKKPNIVVSMGCVGCDESSQLLIQKAREDGVNVCFQKSETNNTGVCAVLITDSGKHRSLCADLNAANHFTIDHLRVPENADVIQNVKYFYVTGFFLSVSVESALELAKISNRDPNCLFLLNISATYVPLYLGDKLAKMMPYVDVVFGNKMEAEAFAQYYNFGTDDLDKIATMICDLPKKNKLRERVAVITQGHDAVILAIGGKISKFPITPIPIEKIVDTNGAGDSFVGGFISQLLLGKPFEVCIQCGIWAAGQVIQSSGITFNATKNFVEN